MLFKEKELSYREKGLFLVVEKELAVKKFFLEVPGFPLKFLPLSEEEESPTSQGKGKESEKAEGV
ncbi:unnamed protein product, partial [marine sediment metagenome]